MEIVHQCSIAVFDKLLSEPHNTDVMRMLFVLAHWHALAKLRMHVEPTLVIFDEETRRLAAELTRFKHVTSQHFDTQELPKESERSERRKKKKTSQTGRTNMAGTAAEQPVNAPVGSESQPTEDQQTNSITPENTDVTGPPVPPMTTQNPPTQSAQPARPTRRKVTFSLSTYKFHALGDYPSTIRQYGTTDSYTTEIVSHTVVSAITPA